MYYSNKYDLSLSFEDIEKLFIQYISYCKTVNQSPEYTVEEFYLFKDNIPSDFINYLIYQDRIIHN